MDLILPAAIIIIGLLLAYMAVQAMGILDVTLEATMHILKLLIPLISVVLVGYLAYILINAYQPGLLSSLKNLIPGSTSTPVPASIEPEILGSSVEPFVQKAMGPPVASSVLNMPAQPIPSPAPPMKQVAAPEEDRTVAPGGPGAPNAITSELESTMSPEAVPMDPYEDMNMEAPIRDSMRHPELSFGPGIDNKGIKKGPASGIMHTRALSSESPFSPEFAQNGGQFMGEVTANDLSHDDTYATA